jgi:hypothetical protein
VRPLQFSGLITGQGGVRKAGIQGGADPRLICIGHIPCADAQKVSTRMRHIAMIKTPTHTAPKLYFGCSSAVQSVMCFFFFSDLIHVNEGGERCG